MVSGGVLLLTRLPSARHRADWVVTWISPPLATVRRTGGRRCPRMPWITFVVPYEFYMLSIAIVLVSALILVLTLRPRFNLQPVASLAF